jgi:two-component system cell cycle response regulator DivK
MSGSPTTVLIVEDNEDNYLIYGMLFEHRGLRVLQAVDGRQGVALARSEHPDVVVMDVSLPFLDGFEATRLLKGDHETQDIPIIIVTSHALPADRQRALDVGADVYLAKPVEPQRVYEELRRLLGGERQEAVVLA